MRRQRIALLTFCALWGGYLVQLASPLRTNPDANCFLGIAASARDGQGFLLEGKRTHFPIGYPMMIAALDRCGLACSASFIGLNLIALASGLSATAYVLHRSFRFGDRPIVAIGLLTMLCWVFIKHVTLPLSDIPYFGLAQGCLAMLTWSVGRPIRSRLAGLGLALLLALAAIAVRTVGISLLPALAFACLLEGSFGPCREWLARNRRRATLVALGVIGGTVATCIPIVRTQYCHRLVEGLRDRIGPGELATLKLVDWGELVFNTSSAKLPKPIQPIVTIAGIVVPVLLVWGACRRKRLAAVDIYFAAYGAILLVWPFRDARFWLPVFPIMLGYVWLVWERYASVPAARWAATAYLMVFGVFGIAALSYSSWISLADARFADRYAGGVYRSSYRVALGINSSEGPQGARVDPQIVQLVRRYSLNPR